MENAGLAPACSPRLRPYGPLLWTLVGKLGSGRLRPQRGRRSVSDAPGRYPKRGEPLRRIPVDEPDGQDSSLQGREAQALGIERDQLLRGGEAPGGAAPSNFPGRASFG